MAEWKIKSVTVRDVWELPGKVVKMYRYEAVADGFPPIFFELPWEKVTTGNIDTALKATAREIEQLVGRKVRV